MSDDVRLGRRARKLFGGALAGIFLLAAAPLLCRAVAMVAAGLNGCSLSDDSVFICVILGADRGEMLHILFESLWLIVFSIPLAGVALVFWYAVLILVFYGAGGRPLRS